MESSSHVLVVDDEEANRHLAKALLEADGCSVSLAENGMAALKLFEERAPDLILLDVMMPVWDGFETCRRIRQAPGGRDVAVIFATALNDFRSHQQAMESGADDFLTKPISRTELLLRVRSLLRIKKLQTELRQGHDLIRTQRDALVVAQRMRESLTSFVVHDFKGPLTAILFNAEWLGENCAGEQAEVARQIVTSTHSMNRMVMNLLDIGRSEDGMLALQIAPVDLQALAIEIEKSLALHSRKQPIEVVAEPLSIEADGDVLRRLVENLIDNASKYSPPASAIRLSVAKIDEEWAEIRVLDEGPGIPANLRERIFDKYVRLSADGEEARSSRGLGLTFCRLAAEEHGGRIWVEDGAQGGSCFCVRLPISQKAFAAVRAQAAARLNDP